MRGTDTPPLRQLEVEGAFNVRDLGGLPTPDGPISRFRLLRSGDTMTVRPEGVSFLLGHGLERVLDLRGHDERPEVSDVFASEPRVTWRNVSLFDYDLSSSAFLMPSVGSRNFLVDGYQNMLASTERVRESFEFVADTREGGCCLFHCAAGMDRTGVLAMLLEGALGVDRAHIVCDYAYSFGLVDEVDLAVASWDGTYDDDIGDGLAFRIAAITRVYDGLLERFGGIRPYLASCGVTQGTLDRLRRLAFS